MRFKKTLKPATNEPATLEFGYKTFNTIHRNLEKPENTIAVLPFGPFFPDFGPEMVRICIKKSGFDKKGKN